MMKMNTLQRDSLLKTSPLMISTRTERRKIEWNESMKDGKTMAELKSIILVPANLCIGNNCNPKER
jgi:hypothetical protein